MHHEEAEIRSNDVNAKEEEAAKKRSHKKSFDFQQDMVRDSTSTSKMYV